jgi:hypothetical protein
MEKINDLFDQETTKVLDAFPSVYTKDDVVTLLSKLRTNVLFAYDADKQTTVGITEDEFQAFATNVQNDLERALCNGQIEVYDTGSAEFSINYDNRIEIENIDVLTDNITDELHNIMLDHFQAQFGKFLINNPE